LTSKNFEPVIGQVSNAVINDTRRLIQELRSRFNLFSQLQDPNAKAHLKSRLEAEIEELYLAMKLMSVEVAPNLLDLFDSQRQAFESVGNHNGGRS